MNRLSSAACLLALVLFSLSAFSQTHYESRIYLGVHGGADFSRVSFTPSVPQTWLPGGNAGLNFRYIEENHFGFIIEVDWEQRGWKDDFQDLPMRYSHTADYLQVPFLAHIYFGRRGKFFINLGPSVSFFLREKAKSNFDVGSVNSDSRFINRFTAHYAESVNAKFDYGIMGGIGGEFSLSKNNSIFLETRYYFGLANLLKSGRTESIRGSNPMTISISAGYWFKIK